jgi:hypothetical protein
MTQTVRTFWQSGVLSLYQRLALKSFADRGHRVEVTVRRQHRPVSLCATGEIRWLVDRSRRDAARRLAGG